MEKLSNSKSLGGFGFSMILLFILAHTTLLVAQSNDYVGRSQFFDIAGIWENETPVKKNCEQGRIVTKLDIKPTIVNTYRVKPYFQLNGTSFPFPEWLDLNISTKDLAYTTSIAEAKSVIMPVDIFGERKLKVYSILVDAAGNETCRQVDLFIKKMDNTTAMSDEEKKQQLENLVKNATKQSPSRIDNVVGIGAITGTKVTESKQPKTTSKDSFIDLSDKPSAAPIDFSEGSLGIPPVASNPTSPVSNPSISKAPNLALLNFDTNNMMGSWIHEWEENTFISRFRIYDNNGKRFVKLYKLLGEKEKVLGEYPVQEIRESDGALVIKFLDAMYGETESVVSLRPLWINGRMQGIDLIVEESYTNGIPYRLKRQFYVKDPDADFKNRAELKIASLEGEWLNLDPTGATYKMAVRDGDAMLWANCAEKEGGCYLGRKALEPADNDMVGGVFKMLTTYRTIDIETNLDVNNNASNPDVIVVTMLIEDIEGLRPTVMRTEVFKRKGVIISTELYNSP